MDIKYSVGHWSAGDFCDRFAPPGYNSDNPSFKNDFEGQCRRTKAAGVDAIEIHQSVFEKGGAAQNGDIDWKALERARDGYLAELGMTVTACNFNTWSNPKFKLGGPCNPDPEIRQRGAGRAAQGPGDQQGAEDPGDERVARLRRRRLSLPDRLQAVAGVVHRGAGRR